LLVFAGTAWLFGLLVLAGGAGQDVGVDGAGDVVSHVEHASIPCSLWDRPGRESWAVGWRGE
ncbi:hypothetical protein, partial [uncultured Senegalimassilia sp.]|uniref:hypothetical protein n=1 Tax=uncultured Senegalimassilia sp. TaxID=1714350 RepID=UPI0025CC629E